MNGILLFLLLFWTGTSHAYQLTCSWVFSEQVETFQKPDSPQRILEAIEQYKKIMGLAEISHKPASLDTAKTRHQSLNAAEKRELLKMIGEYYNEVKSLKYNNEGPFKTFKRHIDLIVSQELNAPQFFREEIYQKSHSLEQALDLFYKKVQAMTGIPVLLKGQDVLLTAIRLQEKFLTKFDSPIVIYGSFVNGKAYTKSSDLDFAVMNSKLETKMRETDLLKLLSDFPLSEAQAHTIAPSQVHALGYLNPLVLIVRKDYIVLRVYENGLHSDFKGKNARFDEFYF
jgi:predicted nucleotidyltransferase